MDTSKHIKGNNRSIRGTIPPRASTFSGKYTVSKNDTDVAHYNVNAYQRILVIFGRDVAGRVY